MNYTALSTDAGDQLQVRFLEDANASSRNLWLDNVSLVSSVPEPSSALLTALLLVGAAFTRRRRKAL